MKSFSPYAQVKAWLFSSQPQSKSLLLFCKWKQTEEKWGNFFREKGKKKKKDQWNSIIYFLQLESRLLSFLSRIYMEELIFSFNHVNENFPHVANENSEDTSKGVLTSSLWLKEIHLNESWEDCSKKNNLKKLAF